MRITIWVCPTDGCGNYYASSSAGNLFELWNTDLKNDKTFQRSRCPDCWTNRRIEVHRTPIVIER